MTARKRRVAQGFVCLAVAAGLLGGGETASSHDEAVTSRVTITFDDGSMNDWYFGSVESSDPVCETYRSVKVYRVRRGPDAPIWTTLSAEGGYWYINPDRPREGRYYARVPGRITHQDGFHNHTCLGTKSPLVRVEYGA